MRTRTLVYGSLTALAAIAAIALASGVVLGESASDRQKAAMKSLLATSSSSPRVPTGIDVPGPSYYEMRNDHVAPIDSPATLPRRGKLFWNSQAPPGGNGTDGGGTGK